MRASSFLLAVAAALPVCVDTLTSVSENVKSRKATLLFQGDVTVHSDTLPKGVTTSQLKDFMTNPDTLKAFASGGDAENSAHEVPLTADWESVWKKYCTEWYGSTFMPQKGDTIFSCNTWTKLPGLQLCTTVYTGVKVLKDKHNIPSYCFLIIGQKQTAKGLPPIVWMFHQIMGTKQTTENEDIPVDTLVPTGPIKSLYCIEERKHDGRLCFRLDTTFQFNIEFPAFLLKIMPLSKAKAEKQGSSSVSQTIAKAGRKGVESGIKAFQNFYQHQTLTANVK